MGFDIYGLSPQTPDGCGYYFRSGANHFPTVIQTAADIWHQHGEVIEETYRFTWGVYHEDDGGDRTGERYVHGWLWNDGQRLSESDAQRLGRILGHTPEEHLLTVAERYSEQPEFTARVVREFAQFLMAAGGIEIR